MIKIIKKIYIKIRDFFIEFYLSNLSEKKKFEVIYKFSYWRSKKNESLSGYGSSIASTENLIKDLKSFIIKEEVKTIFDAPCGDFFWIKQLNFTNLNYTGGDIVKDLIKDNNFKNKIDNVNFIEFDILNTIPNNYDLIINRDCLVHFKDADVIQALKNFKKSKSRFFASTSYPSIKENIKSNLPDNWRPINLCIEPFNLPKPYVLMNDKEKKNKIPTDDVEEKYLAVWKIDDLANLFNE